MYRTTAFVYIFLFFSSALFAQTVIVDEDFSDGDYTNNPTWTDSEGKYTVNASNLLQLNAPSATDEAVISTPSSAAYGEWEALVNLDFNPSSSNLARFYLISDTQNMKGPVYGYYIEVGSSNDEVSLYRQDGNGSTKIIDGTDDLINMNPVTVRIKATRDINGNWELLADPTGGTSFASQGTVTDNTYATSTFTGLFSDYTSTRSTLFEYDAIKVTKVNPPLEIQTVSVIDNQTFEVQFNLDLDPASVQAADFSINKGAGSPNSVSLPSSNTVQLSYNTVVPSSRYTLSVNNVDDADGNTIAANSTANFILYGTFTPGDVVINEFMKDPPGGQPEYVELKNTSSKILNLQNWEIGDETGTNSISSGPVNLEADSFLVIAADTSSLFSVYGHRAYFKISTLNSLNNGGDVVQLKDDSGTQIDSLRYTADWGGNNVALERRSATAPSIYRENFGDSPNPLGGTPGLANEIAEDITPPGLTAFNIPDSQTPELVFSERLENGAASNTANYSLDNGITINGAQQISADSVRLNLSSPLQNNITYQLTVTNQQDIFGNTASTIDTSFTYYEVSAADSGDVFINEFTYDPPPGSTEYIEFYNSSSKSLDLNGWTISDNTGTRQTITNSRFIIPPDSFVVIAPDQTLLNDHPDIALVAMGSRFPSLNNSGDDIILRNASGVRLDSLRYTSAWGGSGLALERRTTDVAPIKSNFGDAPNGFGTPGKENGIPPDSTPPEVLDFFISSDQSLRFVFSEALDAQTAENAANYKISGGLNVSSATLSGPDTVQVMLSGPLQNNTHYTLSASGVEDFYGNTMVEKDISFTYYEVSAADSGDVFINEFTYNPPPGSTEYIEFYNTSSKSLDLNGWTISDNTGTRQTITNSRFIIPPDSFVVIAPDQTLLNNHPDIALVAMGSRFPSLNNSGDDIVLRNSAGQRLDSLRYDSDWGGSGLALERRTTEVPPIKPNFGDAPNGFGTPGTANDILPDSTPPALASFSILNNKSLEFVFSEQLEEASAESISSYSITGGISVNGAVLAGDDTVRITLSAPLQNNTRYTATISGVKDLFGNTLAGRDTSFTYYEISAADSGKVFINEFTYDPPTGSTEYIEIYNPTSRSFDLKEWTLNDNTGNRHIITNSRAVLPPDSFIVLAPDQTLLNSFPGINLVTMGSNFPSLNNGGDAIVIRRPDGILLDSLTYTPAFGGDNVSVERRTTGISGNFAENFGDAPNGFGTPGSANEIAPDETPPVFEYFKIVDAANLQLIFSERLGTQSALNAANYTISPARGIQAPITLSRDTVAITLSQPLQSGQTYTLSVQNINDIFGNTLISDSKQATYIKFSSASPRDIVINEILYDKENAGSPEFVELYNTSAKNIDLANWYFGDASSTGTLQLPANARIQAGEYLVLTDNQQLASSLPNGLFLSGFPALNDGGDAVFIRNGQGQTIDSLFYAPAWGGSKGVSLERLDPKAASNDASNWGSSTASGGNSAGSKNAIFNPDKTPPMLLFSKVQADGTIEIYFTEFIQRTPQLSFSLDGTSLSVAAFDSTQANKITLDAPGPKAKAKGENNQISVQHLKDVKGNETDSDQIAVAQALKPGGVVINEIMFNPLNAPDDNRPDQSEYIELRNTNNFAVSLEGISLHDQPDENNEVRSLIPVNTQAKWIQAGGIALIYADESADFAKSKIADFFGLSGMASSSLIRVDRSSLSLASTGNAAYLADSTGATIDSVFYDESWHNPNLIDTRGISLERIDPDGPGNDKSNWSSSTNPKGGTPGSENSIFQKPNNAPQKSGISFSPNPFSPDNDGFDDNLFINYKLDEPDYLIKVRIYDRYGREVRKLADGKAAGFEGSLLWNGRKEDGSSNRIGIYIVVFQAYDSANGKDLAFKKTVVLARRLH